MPPLRLSGQEAARTDRRASELLFDQTARGGSRGRNREVKSYAKECLVAVDCPGLGLGQAACTTDQDGQSQKMIMAEAADGEWTVYGGDLSNTRYAANDQINAEQRRRPAISSGSSRPGVLGSFETTPIVEDGVMYITTPYNHVFAIDARTGRSSGTTSTSSAPRSSAVARTTVAWRSPATRSTWRPSTPC